MIVATLFSWADNGVRLIITQLSVYCSSLETAGSECTRWCGGTHEKSLSRLGHSIVMNVVLLVKTLYWLVAQRQIAFVQRSGWTCFITLTVNQTMFYGSRVIKNGFEKFLLQEHDLTPTAAEVQLCGIVNEFGQSWWGKYFNCLVTTK